MHPDYERSRWWSTAINYLAMANFTFNLGKEEYSWYMLLGWAECLEELKEEYLHLAHVYGHDPRHHLIHSCHAGAGAGDDPVCHDDL